MTTSMLLVGGHHTFGTQEITLSHFGSLYHLYFKDKIDFQTCAVTSGYQLSNYVASYAQKDFEVVYLVYVGHGEGQDAVEYPFISPGADSADISKPRLQNRQGKDICFRVILDCCNVREVELSPDTAVPDTIPSAEIEKFLALDFDYICLRKGLTGSSYGNRTEFNEALFTVIVNYTYNSIGEFLQLLNHEVSARYKVGARTRSSRTHIQRFISSTPDFKILTENEVHKARVNTIDLRGQFKSYYMSIPPLVYHDYHAHNHDTYTIFGEPLDRLTIG